MDVVHDGLAMLLWAAAGFTVLSMLGSDGGFIQRNDSGRVDFRDTVFNGVCLLPIMYVVMVCFFSFFGGAALLATAGYTFLKYGGAYWPTVGEVWRALDTWPFAPTGWLGFDGIVDAVLSWPAAPVLMIGAIVGANLAFGVLVVTALICRLIWPPN